MSQRPLLYRNFGQYWMWGSIRAKSFWDGRGAVMWCEQDPPRSLVMGACSVIFHHSRFQEGPMLTENTVGKKYLHQ